MQAQGGEFARHQEGYVEEINAAQDLVGEQQSAHRSVCMRINNLAMDRPGILFGSREMASWMSRPSTVAWEMAKRCRRYLLGNPRLVQRLTRQSWVDKIAVRVDSDHAGCLRTRRSTTGLVALHGQHMVKAASTTQTVIALSSGES